LVILNYQAFLFVKILKNGVVLTDSLHKFKHQKVSLL
jgi:hypothetical protein